MRTVKQIDRDITALIGEWEELAAAQGDTSPGGWHTGRLHPKLVQRLAALDREREAVAGNDNDIPLHPALDRAVPGQALMLRRPASRFGTCYGEFVGHVGDGRHVLVRKLISSMYRSRWTKPHKMLRADVLRVHATMARSEG